MTDAEESLRAYRGKRWAVEFQFTETTEETERLFNEFAKAKRRLEEHLKGIELRPAAREE
jgi:hypothetical protein